MWNVMLELPTETECCDEFRGIAIPYSDPRGIRVVCGGPKFPRSLRAPIVCSLSVTMAMYDNDQIVYLKSGEPSMTLFPWSACLLQ
jgi:hypothetical protein